ncbi:MAG: rhodanese-like domain-containing protein [Candidatus Marsarchaeota archaeon]|jgi:rhodanese-related sulfurtransferase|nr:rhodanese-like domain-containing protein [Candidatus Marsarchaeota archaeon]
MQEIRFEEAIEAARKNGTKIVWLGSEPVDYINSLLELEAGIIKAANPMEMLNAPKEEALEYQGTILMCYHGNTSAFVSEMLKDKHGVETFNLKGGITSVVGEIF